MKTIRSIIADDEPGCISNLRFYLERYCPQIEILKTESSLALIPALLKENIDVAFLDIEMCHENIFNILQQAGNVNFDIVFVTAHEKYSLKAFNVDVLDYLLKPLNSEAVINCYNKILRRYSHNPQVKDVVPVQVATPGKNVILKEGEKVYVVAMDDIIYVEAKGAYAEVCIYKDNKKKIITVSKSLSEIEAVYAYPFFYRVHRSFVVNRNKIKEIYKNDCHELKMCTGDMIPIARRKWSDFLSIANI